MKNIPKETIDRLEKLKETVNHHRYLYHVQDTQEMSEAALDSLKDELTKIEKEYPELVTPDSPSQRVAGEPLPEFKKIKHVIPQWSFNDAFSEQDIKDFNTRTEKVLEKSIGKKVSPTYVCELKIDGLKVVLEYREGALFSAATRGNGEVGEDVILNVKTIESVPLVLRKKVNCIVEGEVWLGKKQFGILNKDREKTGEPLYANPRNVAAGTIRQLDPKIVSSRKLQTFICLLYTSDAADE